MLFKKVESLEIGMSVNKNWNELGDEFKDTISDAIKNGDFSNINSLINDTVNCVIDETKKQAKNAVKGYDPSKYKRATPDRQEYGIAQKSTEQQQIRVNKAGRTSAILFNIFGGIGLGFTAVASLVTIPFYLMLAGSNGIMYAIILILICIFGGMIRHGCGTLKKIRRAQQYARLAGKDEYVEIEEVAKRIGKSRKYVLKDMQKMLDLGMYPEGHLDEQKTCLILTDDMYKTYCEMQNARKCIEQEEADRQKQYELEKQNIEKNPELMEMVQEGETCIRKLHELNDCIEGEIISEKLYRMEDLLKEILGQIKIHPEKIHDMHKLMNYYLPTTLKLVQAYSEFDDVKEPDTELVHAKKEIENTLDVINGAFNELLNGLFKDKVYDVTADAQVLQTMLSREGLVKEEFGQKA